MHKNDNNDVLLLDFAQKSPIICTIDLQSLLQSVSHGEGVSVMEETI